MTQPLDPLDPKLLSALRQDRHERAPGLARARVAQRLAAILPPVGGAGGAPDGAPGDGRAGSGGVGRSAVSRLGLLAGGRGIAVGAFLVGGTVGALLHATLAPWSPPTVIYVERPASTVAMTTGSTETAQPAVTTATALPGSVAAPSDSTRPPAPPRPPARPSSQLDAERAILDDARAALGAGDGTRALQILEHHEREFPRPVLAEERDALTVQALARAGRYADARAHADAFRRQRPNSLFLSTVDAAIAAIP